MNSTPGSLNPHPRESQTNDKVSEVPDVDYRAIGLSPQYWSYTPHLIGDLVGMPLVNGVDCFVSPPDSKDNASNNQKSWHIVPLSRVVLRGIATAIDSRPNGVTLIVLDDGTGSIDCFYREDSSFDLSLVMPDHEMHNSRGDSQRRFRFAVGDSLEVMGKIKALTAGWTNKTACQTWNTSGCPYEVRFGCMREVHATSVCVLGACQTKMATEWNGEIVHWLKCIEFSRNVSTRINDSARCIVADGGTDSAMNHMIRNGKEVLPLLGDDISSSILDGSDINNMADLAHGAATKSIFDRKCCQTPRRFRKALFYCHCEATLETLDPNFRFRDAFLDHLLDLEKGLKSAQYSYYSSATENVMDLFHQSSFMPPPLLFTFKDIFNNEDLTSVAREVVSKTNMPEVNIQRLIRKTFASMTNDGILSLYDADKDLYLFVSCSRVIEPFLRKSKLAAANGSDGSGGALGPPIPQPFFVRSVPKKRIYEILNWIAEIPK